MAGIDHRFVVREGMFGGGACVFDYDGDGWEDVYITGGNAPDRLYRNCGDGTFEDRLAAAGLGRTGDFVTQGVASADVDGDGWRDLLVTTIGTRAAQQVPRAPNLLFVNRGDGTFRDGTEAFGLADLHSFSTAPSFGDVNADGWPDLYVANYFHNYDGPLSEITDATIVNAARTAESYLLINEGGERFVNRYAEYGLDHKGFGFGGVFTDIDRDGDLDIYVLNDFGYKAKPNYLLINEYPRPAFRYAERETGLDLRINAMAAAVGDYDEDGATDLFVTNIKFNRFMTRGDSTYVDRARELNTQIFTISWGANFGDFDLDGDLDLFVSNGDLNPYCQPMGDFFFVQDAGRFSDQARAVGVQDFGIGRGSVSFDYDRDGDLDLLVVNQVPTCNNYPVASRTGLYRNDTPRGDRHWLAVDLAGAGTAAGGLGASVYCYAGGRRWWREVDGGASSHLSQGSARVHFGLDTLTRVDSVVVAWPGGVRERVVNPPVDQLLPVMWHGSGLAGEASAVSAVWAIVGAGVLGIALAGLFLQRARQ